MTTLSIKNETLDSRYIRRLQADEDGGYTATIHELPGCIAEGDNAEEALSNLEAVASSWILSAKSSGYKVAEPVDFSGASGKVALRISRRIHQQAAERAELEGTSLNQLISVAIATYLGQMDGVEKSVNSMKEQLNKSLEHLESTFNQQHRIYLALKKAVLKSSQDTAVVGGVNSWQKSISNIQEASSVPLRSIPTQPRV